MLDKKFKYRFVCELDVETANKLTEMADKRNCGKSPLIRYLINEYYDRRFK